MNPTFRLGRIAGIPVGVNWSVVIIAGLIGWTLAASVLPELSPGSTTLSYWIAGMIVAVVFFVSLLIHEFSHAMVGRRYGVIADRITLWLLGGVSQFESEAPSASAEFWIALAGPLMSFALAFVFGAVGLVCQALHLPALVSDSLFWLSYINALLGMFNLLPAYPLDGGRVLRASIWWHHDRIEATRKAARVGSILAWSMIVLGMLIALGGAVISGVWFVLLGWFIDNAGRAEANAVIQQDALGAITVAHLMSSHPVTVPEHLNVDDLIHQYVLAKHHSAFPVMGVSGLVGLVGLDQLRTVAPERRQQTTVGEIAEPLVKVAAVAPNDSGADALAHMASLHATRALVVDATGQLVGIVTHTDLARALQARSLLAKPEDKG
jgi:Zn-dependent protease/predicted transcriptional regulator